MASAVTPVSPSSDLTIHAATGQGKLVKSAVLVYNAAIASNAVVDVQVPTSDDNLLRFFIGLFASDQTAGMITRLLSSGRKMAEIDDIGFSNTHGPLGVYCPCAPNVQLTLELLNKSGGSVTPVSYTVWYAVDDPNWTIGG